MDGERRTARPDSGLQPEQPLTAAAVATAVALVTRAALDPGIPRAAVLGDMPAGEALEAMETVAGGLLAGAFPGDKGAAVLKRIGIEIARLDGGAGGGR